MEEFVSRVGKPISLTVRRALPLAKTMNEFRKTTVELTHN
jgi:hypothetical protein